MARLIFEEYTADYLKLDRCEFLNSERRSRYNFCRELLKELISAHGTAKDISAAIGISQRGVNGMIERYDLQGHYAAKKAMLRKEKRSGHKQKAV